MTESAEVTIREYLPGDEAGILETLDALFARYAEQARMDEGFGDFVVRTGVIEPVLNPAEEFHAGT